MSAFDELLDARMDLISDNLKDYALADLEKEGLIEVRDGQYEVTNAGLDEILSWHEHDDDEPGNEP